MLEGREVGERGIKVAIEIGRRKVGKSEKTRGSESHQSIDAHLHSQGNGFKSILKERIFF